MPAAALTLLACTSGLGLPPHVAAAGERGGVPIIDGLTGVPAIRVRVRLDVTGELFAPTGSEESAERRPVVVRALFDFDEQADPQAAAVVRRYTDAAADIRVGDQTHRTALAPDARRVRVVRSGEMPLPFLAAGVLGDEEYDLLETPFDALLLEGLLSGGHVAVGDGWRVTADAAAGLLAIDTIESGAIELRLEGVADGLAEVRISGTVEGAVDGVPTRVAIEGTLTTAARGVPAADSAGGAAPRWELWGPVARVAVVLRERRQAGHVAPGLDVEARVVVTQTPIAGDAVRPGGPDAEPAGSRPPLPAGAGPGLVWRRDPGGRFDLVRDARWRVVEDGSGGLVMRFVDRGALVAQCSVTAVDAAAAPAAAITPEDLERDIRRSLAGQVERTAEATTATGPDGVQVVRVASTGTAGGRDFLWIHYAVTAADGRRLNVAFTLEPAMLRQFGDADRRIVAGLRPLGRDRLARRGEAGGTRAE